MHNFKKAACSTLAFLFFVVLFSYILISAHIRLDSYYYQDTEVRKEMAGSIDMLISGASHGVTAFDPEIIDEKLNCTSYNISGTMMTSHGRLILLEQEISRNPVKTVMIEVSYNTLSRYHDSEHFEGDIYLLPRIDRFSERVELFLKYAKFEDYARIYSSLLDRGVASAARVVLDKKDEQQAGYYARYTNDVSIPSGTEAALYQTSQAYTPPLEENIETMLKMVELCESNGAEVIFVVTPLSDTHLWTHSGHDKAMQWFVDYCEQNDYLYLDFNLLKNRSELFHDTVSFYDDLHLSSDGATFFSHELSRIIQLNRGGEDISDLFYESYQEALNHSPYAA